MELRYWLKSSSMRSAIFGSSRLGYFLGAYFKTTDEISLSLSLSLYLACHRDMPLRNVAICIHIIMYVSRGNKSLTVRTDEQ